MEYDLIKVFGIQRSGNHAILNWLLGLETHNMLFFNNPRKDQGLLENPSAISLPEGVRSYASRVDRKKVIHPENVDRFRGSGGTLICSYENHDLETLNEAELDAPINSEFGPPRSKKKIIVIRNPFNVAPSTLKMVRRMKAKDGVTEEELLQIVEHRLKMWVGYAEITLEHDAGQRKDFLPINFDFWASNKSYRDEIAARLGYSNSDRFFDFVSDAGGGSSFGGTKEMLTAEKLGSRWSQAEDKDTLRPIFLRQKKVVTLAARIWGPGLIPEEIAQVGDADSRRPARFSVRPKSTK
ncbi:hypothetical protein [Lacimonas salitolerans]|uniref:Sulfotransferase domain-containing protein n=1 Tax=Lacimonas salitolerans TaxID=1323750 RepID=A0ABW4EH06_9RHOB